ncbi:MAG: M15 family metallopeptidase [Lachnospiraceae bacterium]|nr:M15 family metallopeptidase [Lachnospiraceae bacterium]
MSTERNENTNRNTGSAAARRKKRELARRRRRRQYIVMAVLGIAIVALAVVLVFMIKKGQTTAPAPDTQTQAQEQTETDTKESTVTPAEPTKKEPETIELTELQMHTGDLILVNGTYPYDFAANAETVNLVTIDSAKSVDYTVAKAEMQLSAPTIPVLDQMITDCNAALGVNDTGVTSAYRTKEYQQSVYDEYVESQGEDYAKAYVATPGYSEHHTGLAMDMGIYYEGGGEGSFSESENAVWFSENSYKYGFVRRYQEDKTAITKINNEAWHFRYVGIPHATYMTQQNLCLEEYIDYLRSNATKDNPLHVDCQDKSYDIYFTTETTIEKPQGNYEISGNNVDGYIITVEAA